METGRFHRFRVGHQYRVLQFIRTPTDEFSVGEIVVFQSTSHSRYDESTAFLFKNAESGELKAWYLYDDEPDTSAEFFQEAV